MKTESVRTTVEIPMALHRKLKQQAAMRGKSIRALILAGVENVLSQSPRQRDKRVKFPIITSDGPKVDLTNQQIYEYVEFP